jgi:hypothetical protein
MNSKSIKRMLLGLSFMALALYIHVDAVIGQFTQGLEFILLLFGFIMLLKGFLSSETDSAESDTAGDESICPNCGKAIDRSFPICPFCGHQR